MHKRESTPTSTFSPERRETVFRLLKGWRFIAGKPVSAFDAGTAVVAKNILYANAPDVSFSPLAPAPYSLTLCIVPMVPNVMMGPLGAESFARSSLRPHKDSRRGPRHIYKFIDTSTLERYEVDILGVFKCAEVEEIRAVSLT